MVERLDKNAMYNPSTGLLVKNPTHMEVAETSDDQVEIVNAIRDMRVKHMKSIYDYTDYNAKSPSPIPGLPGVLKIRDMEEEEMIGFFRVLMRVKPLITRVALKLGDYDFKREYRGTKIQKLDARKPRHPTEVAVLMADLMSDKTLSIIEMEYKVNSAKAGEFQARGKAFGTREEDYLNDELFKPYLEIEYIAI